MTREFSLMLQLYVNSALGKKTELPNDADIEKVISLAKEHNVYYSVTDSLLLSGAVQDKEQEMKYISELNNIKYLLFLRNIRYAELFAEFEKNDIPYALLKGYSVSVFYKNPYSRVSSDTDVLIDKKNEKKALEILLRDGFEIVEKSTDDMKHSILTHPELGLLELHIALYNNKTETLWFGKKTSLPFGCNDLSFDKLKKLPFQEFCFYILDSDENIEHLFLHNVKHFISGGTSIRALMDFFLVYINDKKIDYVMFYDKVRKMNLEKLFHAMIATIERFMPFEGIDVPFYKNPGNDYVDAILRDMYDGKWLGYGDDGGKDISCELFEKKKKSELNEIEDKGFLKQLFPPVRRLQNNYKYSLRYPVLIPVAWAHRMLRRIFIKPLAKSSAENADRRISLFEKFDLL